MRFIQYIAVGILTSFYFFPIGFSFLPESVNTRMIIAVLGRLLYGSRCLRVGQTVVSERILMMIFIACGFSLVSVIVMEINYTTDYSSAPVLALLEVVVA